MQVGIIITGHGQIASGILSAVEMVTGKTDRAFAIDFNQADNFEDLDDKFLEKYKQLNAYDEILVLCDILGGTPFNRAYMSLSEKANVHFISGVNFIMAYHALRLDADNIDKLIATLIEKTKDYIIEYK